jgi:hypothetical protein
MAGKHRLRNRRVQRTTRHRAIEVVDARHSLPDCGCAGCWLDAWGFHGAPPGHW